MFDYQKEHAAQDRKLKAKGILVEAVEKKLGVPKEQVPELLFSLGLDAAGLAEALEVKKE